MPETLTENHFPTPPRDGTGYGRSPGEVMTPHQDREPAFAVTSWSGAKDFPQRGKGQGEGAGSEATITTSNNV